MSLELLKKRMNTIATTSKITNAMKLVASSKLNKQKKLFMDSKDYFEEYYQVIGKILSSQTKKTEALDENKTLYILISSSMGLCGGYNSNLYKTYKPIAKKSDLIVPVGKKITEYAKKQKYNVVLSDHNIDVNDVTFNDVKQLSNKIYDMYSKNEITSIKIIYTKFVNAITFKTDVLSLMPFDDKFIGDEKFNTNDFDFEPNQEKLLAEIIPQYLSSVFYGSLLESVLCENASRRNAMDQSTDNAHELLSTCKLKYNRIRQASITNEITEIVAGSNDLK